jgi:non-ribosomal peptide synthetase component E (peptide arylation enzyme)
LHDDLMDAVPTCVGITSGYGMTEAPIVSQTDIDAPDDSKRHAEGSPTEGVDMKMVDRDGNEVARGQEGEVVVKGRQVMRGYLDSSLDADVFTADGYLRTGDIGRFDEHGAVVITGRLKDVIIRKGENIPAKEVEDLLFTHPKVADVAVVGLRDPDSGERACAVVVTAAGEQPIGFDEMTRHLLDAGLITRKLPEQLELVDALPRNPSGKILKFELQKRFQD